MLGPTSATSDLVPSTICPCGLLATLQTKESIKPSRSDMRWVQPFHKRKSPSVWLPSHRLFLAILEDRLHPGVAREVAGERCARPYRWHRRRNQRRRRCPIHRLPSWSRNRPLDRRTAIKLRDLPSGLCDLVLRAEPHTDHPRTYPATSPSSVSHQMRLRGRCAPIGGNGKRYDTVPIHAKSVCRTPPTHKPPSSRNRP